jgi:hypothetical protein
MADLSAAGRRGGLNQKAIWIVVAGMPATYTVATLKQKRLFKFKQPLNIKFLLIS